MPHPSDTWVQYDALPPYRVVKLKIPVPGYEGVFSEGSVLVAAAVRISITGNGLLSKTPEGIKIQEPKEWLLPFDRRYVFAAYHIGRVMSVFPLPGGPNWMGQAPAEEIIYRAGVFQKKRLLIPVRRVSGYIDFMPKFDQAANGSNTAHDSFNWEGASETWGNGPWDKVVPFVELLAVPGRMSDEYIAPSNAVIDLSAGCEWRWEPDGGLVIVGDDAKERRLISILGKPYAFVSEASAGRWVGAVIERAEVRGHVDMAALASRVRSMEAALLSGLPVQKEFAIRDEIDYCESYIE